MACDHFEHFPYYAVRRLCRSFQAFKSIAVNVSAERFGCLLHIGKTKRAGVMRLVGVTIHVSPVRHVGFLGVKTPNAKPHGVPAEPLCDPDVVKSIVGVVSDIHDLGVVKSLSIIQAAGAVHNHRRHLEPNARDVMKNLLGVSPHPEAR
jgi:hypothetical protein